MGGIAEELLAFIEGGGGVESELLSKKLCLDVFSTTVVLRTLFGFSWSAHRVHRMLMIAGTNTFSPHPPIAARLPCLLYSRERFYNRHYCPFHGGLGGRSEIATLTPFTVAGSWHFERRQF